MTLLYGRWPANSQKDGERLHPNQSWCADRTDVFRHPNRARQRRFGRQSHGLCTMHRQTTGF